MYEEVQRLLQLATDLDLQVWTRRNGNQIELRFESWKDSVRFRMLGFEDAAIPGSQYHVEHFATDQDLQAWSKSASALLDTLGISHRLRQEGHDLQLDFDTMMGHAVFFELREREALDGSQIDPINEIRAIAREIREESTVHPRDHDRSMDYDR